MYSIVKVELISKFLAYYGVDFASISVDSRAIVVILANILFLLFWFIVAYILYRLFMKVF